MRIFVLTATYELCVSRKGHLRDHPTEHSSRHHAAGQPHTLNSGKVLTMTVRKEAPEYSCCHHTAGGAPGLLHTLQE
jgi:hypothetical protein